MADERKTRKEELLAAARNRLTHEQASRNAGGSPADGSGPVIRYRGQVVRPGGGAPGSPGRGAVPAGNSDDVRHALQKIKTLYRDGLISRAEAEKKRSEILDRL